MSKNKNDDLNARYLKRLEELKEKSGGDSMFARLADGKNYLRIVKDPGTEEFLIEGGMHRDLNLLGAKSQKSCLCPKKFGEDKCPICELLASLDKKKDKETIRRCKAVDKAYSLVVILEDREESKVDADRIQVLSYGKTILEELLLNWTDPDFGDFTDPKSGRVIIIDRSGEGLETTYSVRLRPKTQPFKIIGDIPELMSLIEPKSYEDLEELISGDGKKKKTRDDDDDEDEKPKKSSKKHKDEEEDEDEEETPKKISKKHTDEDEEEEDEKPKSKKRSSRDDDDDDDDDEDEKPKKSSKKHKDEEEDEDEDEDEDEKPKKSSKSKKASKLEEDDEEEEDDDDDDEDEKPKKSSKSKKSSKEERPDCFAKEFSPRDKKCKGCKSLSDCKLEYLSAIE